MNVIIRLENLPNVISKGTFKYCLCEASLYDSKKKLVKVKLCDVHSKSVILRLRTDLELDVHPNIIIEEVVKIL